jgi:hypothetical protein
MSYRPEKPGIVVVAMNVRSSYITSAIDTSIYQGLSYSTHEGVLADWHTNFFTRPKLLWSNIMFS